jgi:POT family proton-dependent oligopeptide transporter
MKSTDNHRHTLYALTFTEFWDRFCYYGIQALLVLYLTKNFLFSDNQAYSLYGTFTALTFASTILGGMLADRLIGSKKAIMIGTVLIIGANILLLFPGKIFMYLGLAVLISGIGLLKPNNASLVGSLHENNEAKREGAFSIFYIGMNAGALLGPLFYGYIAHDYGWHYGFAMSAIGMLLALITIYLVNITPTKQQLGNVSKYVWLRLTTGQAVYLGIAAIIGLFFLLILHAEFFGKLLGFIALITIIGLAIVATKSEPIDRNRIIGLSLLAFFCIFFFACSLQTATTLTLFIERNVNRDILGIHLPTMIFLSLQPLCIILTAPFMAKAWNLLEGTGYYPSAAVKITLGLILAALGFAIFSLAATPANLHHHLALIWLVLGNLILGLGELCVFPAALSAISQLAPINLRSTMMGVLFLSLAFSGYLAGAIAKLVSVENLEAQNHALQVNYAQAFIEIALVTFSISLIMLCINPIIKRLLYQPQP